MCLPARNAEDVVSLVAAAALLVIDVPSAVAPSAAPAPPSIRRLLNDVMGPNLPK
jgi:hypothetical protein